MKEYEIKVFVLKKNRFFKIEFPDGTFIVIESKNGYVGLIDVVDAIKDKENTYIVPISWFEFVKHIIKQSISYILKGE